jgi:hypothetical protein
VSRPTAAGVPDGPEAPMRPGTRANPRLPWPGRSSRRKRLSVSTVTAVTMQDLELEHAEQLPAREILCCSCQHHSDGGGSGLTQVGYGNTARGTGEGRRRERKLQPHRQRGLRQHRLAPARRPAHRHAAPCLTVGGTVRWLPNIMYVEGRTLVRGPVPQGCRAVPEPRCGRERGRAPASPSGRGGSSPKEAPCPLFRP